MAERSDDLRDDSQLWFVGGSTQNHPRRHGLRSVDRDWCSRHGHYRDSVPGRIERGATHSLHRSHRGWRYRPQVRLSLRTLIMTMRGGLTPMKGVKGGAAWGNRDEQEQGNYSAARPDREWVSGG